MHVKSWYSNPKKKYVPIYIKTYTSTIFKQFAIQFFWISGVILSW
jgi:hypothetical protein